MEVAAMSCSTLILVTRARAAGGKIVVVTATAKALIAVAVLYNNSNKKHDYIGFCLILIPTVSPTPNRTITIEILSTVLPTNPPPTHTTPFLTSSHNFPRCFCVIQVQAVVTVQ